MIYTYNYFIFKYENGADDTYTLHLFDIPYV